MEALDLARWQFGITTVYHFFFVPITIGLSLLVAIMQTFWMRTRNQQWLHLTKFFGKLFTINFALGLVTGIVQEFQFGMNWSDYSRFVGDIFGAPLAFEALLAFFLESTFLGLWIFGWGRIPEKLHAACIWLVHIGTVLSAYFILAANSFMQNPVGWKWGEPDANGVVRAEMSDFIAVLTNKVQLVTFPHVITSAYMTGGAFVLAIALWHLWRNRHGQDNPRAIGYLKAAKMGAVTLLISALGVFVTGHFQGQIMTEVQPMKMAAAEAHYETADHAALSLISVGDLSGENAEHLIEIPGMLSFMATNDFSATVKGINNIQEEYLAKWGPNGSTPLPNGYVVDDFRPYVPVSYWGFRLMMGLGFLAFGLAAIFLWRSRHTFAGSKFWWLTSLTILFMPLFANSFGWIFTEMGRQPWVVMGLMPTAAGVSPGVTAAEVWTSLIIFTLLYGALAVVEVGLTLTYAKAGTEAFEDEDAADLDPTKRASDAPFVFTY